MIKGADNIMIDGKAIILQGSIVRGDLAKIEMGEYVVIKEDCIIRPTFAKESVNKKMRYVD